jgi:phosphoribosylaminoimidazole-succinocarboxamide synthase
VLRERLIQAEPIARRVFELLADQWRRWLGVLIDLKIEFGITDKGELVVADVIDPDSWRVVRKGLQLSKEPYRQGASVEEVKRLYTMVADLTSRFA